MKKITLTEKNLLKYFKIKSLKELTEDMFALLIINEVVVGRKRNIFIIREVEILFNEHDKSNGTLCSGIKFYGTANYIVYHFNDKVEDKISGKVTLFWKEK